MKQNLDLWKCYYVIQLGVLHVYIDGELFCTTNSARDGHELIAAVQELRAQEDDDKSC